MQITRSQWHWKFGTENVSAAVIPYNLPIFRAWCCHQHNYIPSYPKWLMAKASVDYILYERLFRSLCIRQYGYQRIIRRMLMVWTALGYFRFCSLCIRQYGYQWVGIWIDWTFIRLEFLRTFIVKMSSKFRAPKSWNFTTLEEMMQI